MAPIGVWNQSNPHGNAIVRSAAALSFLMLLAWSFFSLSGLGNNASPHLDEIVLSGRIRVGTISIPILKKFLDIGVVDHFWRPKTVAFAPSTLAVDPVGWFQNFSFLVDFSLLYSIWLFESARKPNKYTPAKFPVLFGLAAQVFGIGVISPLYFFLHYINAPLSHLETTGMRTIDPHFGRKIFLTLCLFSYLPVFLMFLGPLPSIRHLWTWAWQMFPLWVSIGQWIRTHIHGEESTLDQDQGKTSNHDNNIIRGTISAFAAISAGVWIYMLLNSPNSLSTIFLPQTLPITKTTFIPLMRKHFQISHLSAFGSSFVWLVYLFADLKNSHLVQQSWIFLFSTAALTTICLGPGVTVAVGWCWREEILRSDSVEETGRGRARYKKFARQSLEEFCFGGTNGRFKVL